MSCPKAFSRQAIFSHALTSENDLFQRKEEMAEHSCGWDGPWDWQLLAWIMKMASALEEDSDPCALHPGLEWKPQAPLQAPGGKPPSPSSRGEAGIWHRGFPCHESGRETACVSRTKWNFGVHRVNIECEMLLISHTKAISINERCPFAVRSNHFLGPGSLAMAQCCCESCMTLSS